MARKHTGHRALRAPYYNPQTAPNALQSLQIPTVSQDRPPLHTFSDKALEKRVFTHKSAGIQQNNWNTLMDFGAKAGGKQDNEHLEFLGDSILKGLTAHLIDTLFPEMDEGTMTILMTTLVNNRFYAHLSRTLGLDKRLIIAESTCRAPLDSERVLGGLFEAYVGGMHKEMGMERHMELYSWFRQLMEPYILGFFKQMQGSSQQQQPVRGNTQQRTVREEEDIYTGDVPTFTIQLNEYAAKHRLAPPEFKFISRGFAHKLEWVCEVKLGGKPVMGPPAAAKSAAKNLACRKAMAVVRQRTGQYD